jgi:hypothetical protein
MRQPLDAYGVPITEGCNIAMAFRIGNNADIRRGVVLKIVEVEESRGNPLQTVVKLDVQWELKPPRMSGVKRSKVGNFSNCVVLV